MTLRGHGSLTWSSEATRSLLSQLRRERSLSPGSTPPDAAGGSGSISPLRLPSFRRRGVGLTDGLARLHAAFRWTNIGVFGQVDALQVFVEPADDVLQAFHAMPRL